MQTLNMQSQFTQLLICRLLILKFLSDLQLPQLNQQLPDPPDLLLDSTRDTQISTNFRRPSAISVSPDRSLVDLSESIVIFFFRLLCTRSIGMASRAAAVRRIVFAAVSISFSMFSSQYLYDFTGVGSFRRAVASRCDGAIAFFFQLPSD